MIKFEDITCDSYGCYTATFKANDRYKKLFFQNIDELMQFVGVDLLYEGGKLPNAQNMTDSNGIINEEECINYVVIWMEANAKDLRELFD